MIKKYLKIIFFYFGLKKVLTSKFENDILVWHLKKLNAKNTYNMTNLGTNISFEACGNGKN